MGAEGSRCLSTIPEIADVSSDQQNSGLSSNVVIDRDTASRLGLTAQAVDSALYDAFGQRQVSVMYKSINQYHVVLALQQQWWESPDFLKTIYVQTPKGTDVPLSTFTHFTQGLTPISLPHQGQFPATTISFNLAEDVALSDAENAIFRAVVEIGLPANITGKFAGTARAYQEALANQPILIGTALIAVYIVLGILYESLIHPLTIISTLPSAGVGSAGRHGAVQEQSGPDRHDRNHPADRHREEERDHDDRFRAGGRTERRDEFARCDLPGLSAAVPADHDDDHVRAAGRDADGARLGRRSGAAQAPRNLHCRRPGGQPDVDFVYHACDLSLLDKLRKRLRGASRITGNRPGFLVPGGLAESGD